MLKSEHAMTFLLVALAILVVVYYQMKKSEEGASEGFKPIRCSTCTGPSGPTDLPSNPQGPVRMSGCRSGPPAQGEGFKPQRGPMNPRYLTAPYIAPRLTENTWWNAGHNHSAINTPRASYLDIYQEPDEIPETMLEQEAQETQEQIDENILKQRAKEQQAQTAQQTAQQYISKNSQPQRQPQMVPNMIAPNTNGQGFQLAGSEDYDGTDGHYEIRSDYPDINAINWKYDESVQPPPEPVVPAGYYDIPVNSTLGISAAIQSEPWELKIQDYSGNSPLGYREGTPMRQAMNPAARSRYVTYLDGQLGQIRYDERPKYPYESPNFVSRTKVDHLYTVTPQGQGWPQYNRGSITPQQIEREAVENDFMTSQVQYRQELMERQMRKRNSEYLQFRNSPMLVHSQRKIH